MALVLISLGVVGAIALAIAGLTLWSLDDGGRDAFSYRLGQGAAPAAQVYYMHAAVDYLPEACEMALNSRYPNNEHRGRTIAEGDFIDGCLRVLDN